MAYLRGIILVGMLAMAVDADAHSRSMSYSTWHFEDDTVRVEYRISELELTRFPYGVFEAAYLADRLVLLQDGEALPAGEVFRVGRRGNGWAVFTWEIALESGRGPLTIRNDTMLDIISSHQHFARIETGAPGETREQLLDENRREWTLGQRAESNGFADYLALGIGHILGGWDHLAFVVGLLLLSTRAKEIAFLVTGFTIAHSVTLALAALDVVRPDTVVVEIFVAFSIALVAVEAFYWTGDRDRFAPTAFAAVLFAGGLLALFGLGALSPVAWAGLILFVFAYFTMQGEAALPHRIRLVVTLAFGLVHGFGFAGALLEIGLPAGRTVAALFGFNLGVEIGQLGVVALGWPLLLTIRGMRAGEVYPRVAAVASGALFALSLFWVCLRNFGI